MIIRPCAQTLSCPGTDEPISNYSSEAPDGLDYLSRQYYGNSPPPFRRSWNANGCGQTFISQISQADAEQQAAAAAALCADAGPCIGSSCGPGIGGGGAFCNNAQTACVPCPDGNQFCYTVPAGVFCGYANQARADSYAHGVAFRLAREKRFCLSNLNTPGCVGQAYNQSITATGPVITPCTWTIVAGILPPGLEFGGFSPNIDTTLGPTETIQGTPTTAGSYTFTVQCEGSDFSFMQKQYTICVSSIIPTSLPAGLVGTAYNQALTIQGGCLTSPSWSVTKGSLNTGLSLNATTGVISGTPQAVGVSQFSITATAPNGACTIQYLISVTNPSCVAPTWCPTVYIDPASFASLGPCTTGLTRAFTLNNPSPLWSSPTTPFASLLDISGGQWVLIIQTAIEADTYYLNGTGIGTGPYGVYSNPSPHIVCGVTSITVQPN